MKYMENHTLTALKGVRVGHSTQTERLTGCTAILFDEPYPVAYAAYGGGPGTFGTESLRNGMTFHERHGLFVAGGSLAGLMSASEIMRGMIEDGIGFKVGPHLNPALSGAVVADLGMNRGQYDPKTDASPTRTPRPRRSRTATSAPARARPSANSIGSNAASGTEA